MDLWWTDTPIAAAAGAGGVTGAAAAAADVAAIDVAAASPLSESLPAAAAASGVAAVAAANSVATLAEDAPTSVAASPNISALTGALMGVLVFALACCVGSLCVFGGQKLFSREGGLPSSRPRRKGRQRLPEEETELPKAPARSSMYL